MIGYVYKLSSNFTNKIYIGSTTQTLGRRFTRHKSCLKNDRSCSSKIIMSFNDCKITLLEEVEFRDKKLLLMRERFYIDSNLDIIVNKCLPTQSKLESTKKSWDLNRQKYYDKRAEKIVCEICCKSISKGNFARHMKLH